MPANRRAPSETLSLFGNLSVEEFLSQYWQQRPLLIRQAFTDFENPLTPEELAGFACDEHVESLLVLEKHGPRPWHVEHGPFSAQRITELPDSHASLLVHAVDQLVPAFTSLKNQFNFVPRWRLDDVMVSYANTHGSVGPHRDQYDVFLLQTFGRRRWRVNSDTALPHANLAESELSLLEPFPAEHEWVLEAGDMLYLPPGVAHHGVALEPCMTCSIGFRAPSQAEMVTAWADEIAESFTEQQRYHDPHAAKPASPGVIEGVTLTDFRALLDKLDTPDIALARAFGKLVTRPTRIPVNESYPEPTSPAELVSRLQNGELLIHHPATRLACWFAPDGGGVLFCDGDDRAFTQAIAPSVDLLCNYVELNFKLIGEQLQHTEFMALLDSLYHHGKLAFSSDIWV